MAADVERRLRELAPRMQRLDELKAERDRQKAEIAVAEELLKQLKWNCYQAKEAYEEAEAKSAGLGGFLATMFTGTRKGEVDELLQKAQETREVYELAKEKLKPLKDEFVALDQEIQQLETARPEYEAALAAQVRTAAGAAGGQVGRHQEELSLLSSLILRGEDLVKQANRTESILGRIDRSNLFSARSEMTALQKGLSAFILESQSLPREWGLPPLPTEADVRMYDPVGASSNFHAPPNDTLERVADMAMYGRGFDMAGTRAKMRAIVNAAGASDDAVRTEGRHQAMQVGSWCRQVTQFLEGLRRMRTQTQTQLEALLLSTAPAAAPTLET